MSQLGKNIDFSDGSEIQPQGSGCTITCSGICQVLALKLCKCKVNGR